MTLRPMIRRPLRRRRMDGGGFMRYVVCPKCGDPVASRLAGELTCVQCKEKFTFDESQVRSGVVLFDSRADRWKVG